MASGSFYKSISSYDYRLIVEWTSASTISSNSSKVTAKIKLYAPYQLYIGARTGNTITINGKDYTYSSAKISTDNGGTYTLATVTSDAITHNADGTKSISITCKFKLNATINGTQYNTVTASGTAKLDNIPRAATISAAPNFNDEENPTITYANPAGNNVTLLQACIANSTGSTIYAAYRDISKAGGTYTFSLTSAERTALRQACSAANSMSIKFYVKTELGGETYLNSVAKTLSIVNANPTIDPAVYDQGSVSITLTGDADNKVIKGYNTMNVAINATANKNATIKSYKISCGGKSITTASGLLSNVESGTFTFTATDSRGNSTTETVTKTLINYIPLTCTLEADNPTPEGDMSFKISGNAFNGSFGAVSNTLTIQYRYKVDGGSYGSWITVTPSLSGNTYAASPSLSGLDYRQAYVFQARAVDKINTGGVATGERKVQSIPVFDWSGEDFNFNVPVNIEGDLTVSGALSFNGGLSVGGNLTIGGNTLRDYIVEHGTASMGSNGTWYWIKWNSGKAECWGQRNFGNMAVSNAWGSLYESASQTQSFPSGLFNAVPITCDIQYLKGDVNAWIAKGYASDLSATSTGKFSVVRPLSGNIQQVYLGFHVIGRWK